MKVLTGVCSDGTLESLLYSGEITTLDYVNHQSEKMQQDFVNYCHDKGLEQNEVNAQLFLDYTLNQEKNYHSEYLD